jgi:hypothetical protein
VRLEERPSLYTRWLSRSMPHIPQPDVVLVGLSTEFAGFYLRPGLEVGEFRGGSRGLIALADCYGAPAHHEAAIVAHEWRHHWQHWSGFDVTPRRGFNPDAPYEGEIAHWLAANPRERDAVRFESRMAPQSGIAAWWLELLRKNTDHRSMEA